MDEKPVGVDLALLYRLIPGFVLGAGASVMGCALWGALLLAAAVGASALAPGLLGEKWRRRRLLGLLVCLSAAAGLWHGARAPSPPTLTGRLGPFVGKRVRATATVLSHAKASVRGVRVRARLSDLSVLDAGSSAEGIPPGPGPVEVLLQVDRERNPWIYSPGALLRVRGRLRRPFEYANPGVHSYRRYLALQGIEAVLYIPSPWGARVERWPEGWQARLARQSAEFSKWVRRQVGDSAALINALAVGNRQDVSPELTRALRAAGTSHILAISGLHIAVAGAFFFFLVRWLLLRSSWLALHLPVRKLAVSAALCGVLLYALLSGYSEATQRASVMFAAGALALVFERRLSGLRTLQLAALLIVLAEPRALASISFQLSFAAATAIVLAFGVATPLLGRARPPPEGRLRRVRRALGRVGRGALAIVISSLAANLGTWPLVALYFNRLSLNGLVANLVVLPLVELALLPASLLALGLWTLSPALALPVLQVAAASARAVEGAVGFFVWALPRDVGVRAPGAAELIFYFGALVLLGLAAGGRARWAWRPGAVALAGYLGVLCIPVLWPLHRDLEVQVFDAGRAEVTLARWPDGRRVLVDRTRSRSDFPYAERVVLPALLAARAHRLDLLVFAATGPAAEAALESYERELKPARLWHLGAGGTSEESLWPGGGEPPRVRLLQKGWKRRSGHESRGGWALALLGRRGRYVIDGAPGYWHEAWPRLWRQGPTVLQLTRRQLRTRPTRWLLRRVGPALVVVPGREGPPADLAFPAIGMRRGGWARLRFSGDRIRIDRTTPTEGGKSRWAQDLSTTEAARASVGPRS